jgi:hypothetical protein
MGGAGRWFSSSWCQPPVPLLALALPSHALLPTPAFPPSLPRLLACLQGDVLCAEILWSSMRQNLPAGERSRLLSCLMHKVVPTGEADAGSTAVQRWQERWQGGRGAAAGRMAAWPHMLTSMPATGCT